MQQGIMKIIVKHLLSEESGLYKDEGFHECL